MFYTYQASQCYAKLENTYLVEKVIATDIDLRGDRNKITIPLKHFVWK